ncbi:M48 family metalloprotease, partial [Armatimonas sp.]|uniref:M48 family metalloprotease n=1 Tax=Armatimonas sp. TaxID=1872638 RepID=UPI00286B6497
MLQQQDQNQLPEDKVPLLVRMSFWLWAIVSCSVYFLISRFRYDIPIHLGSIFYLFVNLALAIIWGFVYWWTRAKTRILLTTDHPMAESAGTFAVRSGLIIKRLYVFPSPRIDAYRTPAGSLYLSSALLSHLTPREAEAMIAYNIHLGTAKWGYFFGLAFLVISGLFTTVMESWLHNQFGVPLTQVMFYVAAIRVVLTVVINIFGYLWEKHRAKAADAFAVKVTGDPERVVQAILKAHFLSPGIMQGSMENPP